MNRLGVFSLVVLGAGAGAGAVVYGNHLNKGGHPLGGKGKKKHGHGRHGAHESARHHAHHSKKHPAGKTTIAGMHLDNIALGAVTGAGIMAAVLWKPCACLPGAAAVPPGTPGAQPPPQLSTGTIPSATQGNFGPIR